MAFLVTYASIWKYDSVFRLMQKDPKFHPFILVAPNMWLTEENRIINLKMALDKFKNTGYETYSMVDVKNKVIPLRNFKPDILFYTRPYSESFTFLDVHHTAKYLKCYVNYGFDSIKAEWGIASAFHGLMWRVFGECEAIKQLALSYQPKEMQNMIVTGYPTYDEFQEATAHPSAWKDKSIKYRRVIWAPHHSIEGMTGMLQFSTFLLYSDIMLNLAKKYRDKIQFVFKPHPLLRNNLYNHPNWGQEKTDAYYNMWRDGENTNLEEGEYVNLFKSSDALIHDCGSFIVEYLYTQKPTMFLATFNRENQSNDVGIRAFAAHYHGYSEDDIINFIDDVVLGDKDEMLTKREQFYNQYLMPPNGCPVAENIVNELKKELIK